MGIDERIDEVAWALFAQHGYARVTMDDLAAALGISKKTLYNAIPGKAELLHRLVQARLEEAAAETAALVDNPDLSSAEKLRGLPRYALSQLGAVQPVLLEDIRRLAPDTWALIEAARDRLIADRVGAVIRAGMASGDLRADLDPEIVQTVFYDSLRGVITGALPLTDPLRFARLLETTMDLLLHGLLTHEGASS
ncbi:MAG: TetR/AcrR family transcriptional regulator [Chloroflexi bacterium]|nr:TetR/AcrR family transcriptional regulator [Chloroflexota bacterium]